MSDISNDLTKESSGESTWNYSPCDLCYDVAIIGGGVAGLSAALYTGRDGFKTVVFEGEPVSATDLPGGALMSTDNIQNFPGFHEDAGHALIEVIHEQAEQFGAEILTERVEKIEFSSELGGLHKVYAPSGVYRVKSVIIASGATPKALGVEGEDELFGRGVSTCATCDGFFFKQKSVAVVGGGDTAVEDALLLTKYASRVHVFLRGHDFRAVGGDVHRLVDHEKVEIHRNTQIISIHGEDTVSSVRIRSVSVTLAPVVTPDETLDLDGIFVAVGRIPNTSFLDYPGLKDSDGYVLVQGDSTRVQASLHGVFAAGDAVDRTYRQAITSAGKAVQAALEARHYLLSARANR